MAQMKEKAMREGTLPDEMGLMPDTLVMPGWSRRPSWWGEFGARWFMEKQRLLTRVQEAAR